MLLHLKRPKLKPQSKKKKNKAKKIPNKTTQKVKTKPNRKVKIQEEIFESTQLATLPISSEIFRKYFMCFNQFYIQILRGLTHVCM